MTRCISTYNSKNASSVCQGVLVSGYSNGEASNAHSTFSLAAVLKRATGAIRPTAMALLLAALSLTAACGSGGGSESGAGVLEAARRVKPVTPSNPPAPIPGTAFWSCAFPSSATDCGFEEQAKVSGRASLVNFGREGGTAVRLHTEPGDNNVVYSGDMERNDLWISQAATDGYEGKEAWWAHSILFPDDFAMPTWQMYVVADFHNSGSGPWQANFHVNFEPGSDTSKPGNLTLRGYGGVNSGDNGFSANVGQVQRNVWYDFVYHVKWSSGSDGYFDAWVNGVKVLSHRGPTLYSGQGVYLKLANYHTPVCDPYPACVGTHSASSVIHDRVIRGSTALAVSAGPLEGVLILANGVLTLAQQ